MNALFVLLLAVVADPAEPCAPVPAPPGDEGAGAGEREAPDAETAAAYRAVGDEERRLGDLEAARTAYRAALRRDPGDAQSRAALEALCRAEPSPADPFDEATRLMERGDRAGAISIFEAIRTSGPDPSAALLEGICELELGHDGRARALLEEARSEPKVADVAAFFLGLLALEAGEPDRATAMLSRAAAAGGSLAESAADLIRVAGRDGKVVASALSEVGFDSNVELLPDGTTSRASSADGYGAALAGLLVRPLGTRGPYARVIGQYRKQARITSYDLGQLGVAIGARAGRADRSLAAEYAYDFLALGSSSYLSAHRLLATGRWGSGRLSVTATYALRLESYLTDATMGYSGARHDAEAEGGWQLGHATNLALGYHLGRDGTRDPALRYLEHGPFALLRLGAGGPLRLFTEGRLTARGYDQVDPDLGLERSDRYLDAILTGEMDVAQRWTVRLGATARRALSNVPDLRYTKVTASVGVVYAIGGL